MTRPSWQAVTVSGRARCRQRHHVPLFSGTLLDPAPETILREGWNVGQVGQVVSKIGVIKKLPTKFKHIGFALMGK